MKNLEAYDLARRIVAVLQPMCDRIEIAGSIRRARPEVNDIDLVILPKRDQVAALRARILLNSQPISDGPQNMIVRLKNGVQLDVFIARHREVDMFDQKLGNFGSLLVCRTGSREHNIHLVEEAKRLGLKWNPYAGVSTSDGPIFAAEEEEDIFSALSMEFVPPAMRG